MMQKMSGSSPLRLGVKDFVKLGKSCVLAAAGAALSSAVVYVGNLESSSYAWLVPLATVGINMLRKFVMDTTE